MPHSWRRRESKGHGKLPGARKIERDPNHPRWFERHAKLVWWSISIRLLGSDPEGRQHIIITKGASEPVYLRFGRTIEIFRAGKKINWEVDSE